MDTRGLPGADFVERGLLDLANGVESDAALLVLIGEPRLRRLGMTIPTAPAEWLSSIPDQSPEHRLYARLAEDGPDSAHSRYNALIRALVSFERAAECVKP